MALTLDSDRQYPTVAMVDFTYATLASGVNAAIDIPAGAVVVDGGLMITTAFNSGTTDLLEVGDSVNDDDGYVAGGADNGSTAGLIAVTPNGYKYLANDTIDIKWTPVGTAASAGAGFLWIAYIQDGKSNENFG